MRKPYICYTAYDKETDNSHYINVIEEANGIPVIFDSEAAQDIEGFIDRIDGIVLTGGSDIDPSLYGDSTQSPYLGIVRRDRDIREIELIKQAVKKELPIIGSCRGAQIVNIALGGTLWQDLAENNVTSLDHKIHPRMIDETVHEVRIKPNTQLYDLFIKHKGNDLSFDDEDNIIVSVNSSHHQAIKDVSPLLRTSAVSVDGIIEGIEIPSYPFFVCLQWHPEDLTTQHFLYKEFITHSL